MSDAVDLARERRRGHRRRVPRPWREGGSTTRGWDAGLLGWAVGGLGGGVLAAQAAALLLPPETATDGARVLLWLSLAVPVGMAFSRSRPRGLLRASMVDPLSGIVVGVLLRIAQGVLAGLDGRPVPWPSLLTVDGSLPADFAVDAVTGTLLAPVLEELFFRGVVLVSLFLVLGRIAGRRAGGTAAVALATALFVVVHPAGVAFGDDGAALVLVGVVTGCLVVGTGRIWPAVAVHVVFNATGYVLLAVGTLLA